MKKYLPFGFLLGGLAVFVVGFLVMKGQKTKTNTPLPKEDEKVSEIPFSQRPFVSLTPKSDGHWLSLHVSSIKVKDAATLDYELLYKTKQGNTQGVPGSINLANEDGVIDRELLLGSESSGKFRYDEGVEEGTLTIRFRNDKGKLVGKLSTDFHLQTMVDTLSSTDGKFTFTMSKKSTKGYYLTMQTFGLDTETQNTPVVGPYGVFYSEKTSVNGKVMMGEGSYYKIEGKTVNSFSKDDTQTSGVFFSS